MKTRTLLRAFSLGLMIFGMTTIYARPIESPNPVGQVKQSVTYVVSLVDADHLTCDSYILLTNERGQTVAPPQHFRKGVSTYIFKELGSGTSTRIAKVILSPNMICPNAFIFAPESKTVIFKAGSIYQFTLVPVDGTTSSEN